MQPFACRSAPNGLGNPLVPPRDDPPDHRCNLSKVIGRSRTRFPVA
jgi:hypothetical protein